MRYFANKTASELKNYLEGQSLDTLKKLNRGFGPYFEKIEEQLEKMEEQKPKLEESMQAIQGKYLALKLQESQAQQEENEYRLMHLNGLENNQGGSRSERFLAQNALMVYSPLQFCKDSLLQLEDDLRNAKNLISDLEQRYNARLNDRSGSVAQLKLLNSIIEERENQAMLFVSRTPS